MTDLLKRQMCIRDRGKAMKRVTLIITAVLTVLMLTACSSNKVVYESNTESQGAVSYTHLGVISFLNDLPICPMPKGTFLRLVRCTFLKFTKIPGT